jgi:hypothetical protein
LSFIKVALKSIHKAYALAEVHTPDGKNKLAEHKLPFTNLDSALCMRHVRKALAEASP